jgi:ribulose kinase
MPLRRPFSLLTDAANDVATLKAAVGLPDLQSKLPTQVVQVGALVSDSLLPELASTRGLPTSVKVYAGGGDAFVGLLGVGVTRAGEYGLITGSSNCFSGFIAPPTAPASRPEGADGDKEGPLLPNQAAMSAGLFGPFVDAVIPGLSVMEAGQA